MGAQVGTREPRLRARTHEEYVRAVRDIAVARATQRGKIDAEESARLLHAKLVYGVGNGSYRGVCHYGAWVNGIGNVDVVEIAATAEESWIQLAGTTIHELGHVLALWGAGHGPDWKAASDRLGLRNARAAGMVYTLAALDPVVREQVARLAVEMADGSPSFATQAWLGRGGSFTIRPCSAGTGTRGGTSRGPGSGSRMVKVTCQECGYTARLTRKWLNSPGAPFCGNQSHGRMEES